MTLRYRLVNKIKRAVYRLMLKFAMYNKIWKGLVMQQIDVGSLSRARSPNSLSIINWRLLSKRRSTSVRALWSNDLTRYG